MQPSNDSGKTLPTKKWLEKATCHAVRHAVSAIILPKTEAVVLAEPPRGKGAEVDWQPRCPGLKYLDLLLPLVDELHAVRYERDKAGNRTLHCDQSCNAGVAVPD